jgi:hypothetical protein
VSKSNSGGLFGRKSPAQVTVIAANVHRASARNARLALILTALLVGGLSMAVLSDSMHPILSVFAGAFIGIAAGGVVWLAVTVWPVLRAVWWWATEIVLAVVLLAGWNALANAVPLWARLVVVGLVLGVPAGVGPIRRRVVALAWCVIVRHRLRQAFSQFIASNKTGTLPFILIARPTPVGERVWVYLRPGLSLAMLQPRLDQLAVACHAIAVQVVKAGEGNSAAFVRFDIKRREVLTAAVGSPLTSMVDPATPQQQRQAADLPTALNLGDIPTDAKFVSYVPSPKSDRKPTAAGATANGSKPAAADDENEWI